MRQIILDTETTGLSPEQGHRIIEIGCVEIIDRRLTDNHYHCYINPEREIDKQAIAVHGITQDFLKDKPTFSQVITDFMNFVDGAELIIHNAPFDVGFINWEIKLFGAKYKSINAYCHIIDTLAMARKMHAGARNSLDALCKRYGIDNSGRSLHGALLDAELLADVYLMMTSGQNSLFGSKEDNAASDLNAQAQQRFEHSTPLNVIKSNTQENHDHANYLEKLKKKGACQWAED
jgi:DNA polymerase III subunit epsilon